MRAFLVHANAPSLSFTSGWLQKHISRWYLPMRPREIRYNFPLRRLSSLSSRLIHLMAPITSTTGPQSISFNRWVVLVANRWALSRGRYFPREKPSHAVIGSRFDEGVYSLGSLSYPKFPQDSKFNCPG